MNLVKDGIRVAFILFIIVLFLPLSSALIDNQNVGTYKQFDNINLAQTCVNNTYSNITSINVNGNSIFNSSASMNLISDGYQNFSLQNTVAVGHYIVTGTCDENGVIQSWSYSFDVTLSGLTLNLPEIIVYLFFLFVCLLVTYYSGVLFNNNAFSKDVVSDQEMYETKKRNEFLYYARLMKQKLWIVGVFGVYLSILVFTALLSQLVFNLGLSDLYNVIQYVPYGLAWGLIPFTIFWFVWLLIVFYLSSIKIMRFQFGSVGRGK